MKRILITSAIAATLFSCGSKSSPEETKALLPPSDITVTQSSKTSARLTWKDNSEGESGFSVFLTQDKASASDRIGFTVENTTSYSVTRGLEDGRTYYFGVRADGAGTVKDSEIVWSDSFTLEDPDRPKVTLAGSPLSDRKSVV